MGLRAFGQRSRTDALSHTHDEKMPVKDVVLRAACLVSVALRDACTGPGVQDKPPAQPGTTARAEGFRVNVLSAATAARCNLRSIADPVDVAPKLLFGGPPECPKHPQCPPGLERSYGLHFRAFAPPDAGGPLTLQALLSRQIGVGLLFTTDPSIAAPGLIPDGQVSR